jgi:hypothetical protein
MVRCFSGRLSPKKRRPLFCGSFSARRRPPHFEQRIRSWKTSAGVSPMRDLM